MIIFVKIKTVFVRHVPNHVMLKAVLWPEASQSPLIRPFSRTKRSFRVTSIGIYFVTAQAKKPIELAIAKNTKAGET